MTRIFRAIRAVILLTLLSSGLVLVLALWGVVSRGLGALLIFGTLVLGAAFSLLWLHKRLWQVTRAQMVSQERYREIFNATSDAVFIHDAQTGVVIDVNDTMLHTYGCTREEAVGDVADRFSEGVAPYDRAHAIGRVQAAMKKGVQRFEWRARKSDGTVFWVEVTLRCSTIGGTERIVASVRDISHQKAQEELFVQSEKMISLGRLAAGVAHEINNPLSGIIQSAEVMGNRLTNVDLAGNQRAAAAAGLTMGQLGHYVSLRKIDESLAGIHDAGTHAAVIVDNMLRFARRDEGNYEPESVETLLRDTVELAGSDYDLRTKYDFKQIERRWAVEADLPKVRCVASKLQQVFFNLLRNGAQAMQESRAQGVERSFHFLFSIRYLQEEKAVEVKVTDNGPGMSSAIRNQAFEPFFTTRKVGQGSGLGLSVAYFIITESHRGKMWVASTPGVGTTFTMVLPVDATPAVA